MATPSLMKENLAKRIAGEIILSNEPGTTLRKWREIFNITQTRIAKKLRVSPSVISDYESGRRKSPGTLFVRRFVEGMLSIDEEEGGHFLMELSRLTANPTDAIIDLREFPIPVKANSLCIVADGEVVACKELLNRDIYGYTILDSIRAIQTLSGMDFQQIFGSTTERALIFTNVTSGRSPMVAVRVNPLKPRMIIVHGPRKIDRLAIHLAEVERVPLVLSKTPSVDALIHSLNEFYRAIIMKKEE